MLACWERWDTCTVQSLCHHHTSGSGTFQDPLMPFWPPWATKFRWDFSDATHTLHFKSVHEPNTIFLSVACHQKKLINKQLYSFVMLVFVCFLQEYKTNSPVNKWCWGSQAEGTLWNIKKTNTDILSEWNLCNVFFYTTCPPSALK